MGNLRELVSWNYSNAVSFIKGSKEGLQRIYLTDEKGREIVEGGEFPIVRSWDCLLVRYPYFEIDHKTGYTRKARNYGKCRRDMQKRFPKLERKLKYIRKSVYPFGEYVFLDLGYLDNWANPIRRDEEVWYGRNFVKREKFTAEFVQKLVDYVPLTAIDRVPIKDYREHELPVFLSDLKIFFPEIYKDIKTDIQVNYLGRKVLLKTLSPGKVKYSINGDDHKEIYDYNGEILTRKEKKDDCLIDIKIIPEENFVVFVADNSTINVNTKFVE